MRNEFITIKNSLLLEKKFLTWRSSWKLCDKIVENIKTYKNIDTKHMSATCWENRHLNKKNYKNWEFEEQ